jgi:hypothetical protein
LRDEYQKTSPARYHLRFFLLAVNFFLCWARHFTSSSSRTQFTMLFLTKRHTGGSGQKSGKETCLSILGLFLAICLIGGLAALIYGRGRNENRSFIFMCSFRWLRSGLVVGRLSVTIAGAVVFGVGVLFTVVFILLVFFCLKETTPKSSAGNHQRQQQRHRPEMSAVSSTQAMTTVSHNVYPNLGEHIHGDFGQHPVQSPTKTQAFSALNQSHSSATSHYLRDHRFD